MARVQTFQALITLVFPFLVHRRFGVVWPVSFDFSLDVLAVISLDFGALTSILCIAKLSFYGDLLCSTLGLLLAEAAILLGPPLWQKCRNWFRSWGGRVSDKPSRFCKLVAVYLLLFAVRLH